VLDSISPEERLMRGVPKNISKVIIHHPSQVSRELLMEQMISDTETKDIVCDTTDGCACTTVVMPLTQGFNLWGSASIQVTV
jgi:hypothetical protein